VSLILLAALAAEAAPAASPPPMASSPITVTIANVRNAQGRVHVALCLREKFLASNCPIVASAPAQAGTVIVIFPAVPPGLYAAQAFHDENGNKKMDQNFLSIPREGFGFSRDARVVMSPPQWADAVFTHEDRAQTIHFSLRYMMGPNNPAAWAQAHPAP